MRTYRSTGERYNDAEKRVAAGSKCGFRFWQYPLCEVASQVV